MPDFGTMPKVSYSVTRLGGGQTQSGVTYPGGLDQTTPSLSLQPGALRGCSNFECSQSGGYSRIQGYERLDGKAKPSGATFQIIQFASFTTIPSVGDSVVQDVTGATGTVFAVNNVLGAYYIAVTQITGTFDDVNSIFGNGGASFTITAANPQTITAADPLTISDAIVGTPVMPSVALSALVNAQYLAAAADIYRALIGPVPGSGRVDVVGMDFSGLDYVFAFRANETNTAVNIYKASGAGWVNVPLLDIVSFTTGAISEPIDGEVLSQGGVTALIGRVMTQDGGYDSGDALGDIVIYPPSGGNFAAGPATTPSGATLVLSGRQTQITLIPGGEYEFSKYNFSGQPNTRRIYGCDGVNKCFEFDGQIYAPITTGFIPDNPSHLTCHKDYLVVSKDGSISGPGAGTPFRWDAIDGGWEIATGDIVTGLITLPGSQSTATLAVFLRGNTAFLYGTDPDTFNYVSFNTGTGALPRSAQNLFDTFVFDDLGAITLKTTLNYGNFLSNTLTRNLLPFVEQEREKISASSLNRSKSQYRVFFSDGYGLWLTTVNQQYLGAGVVFFPNPVASVDEVDLVNGGMTSYFGSSDGLGYVYELDKGTSFDGQSLDAYITLAWDAIKSPRVLKRFRAASVEVQGDSYAAFNFGYTLGYGTPNIGQPNNQSFATNFAGTAVWDSFVWDNFIWDGTTLQPTEVSLNGTAENIQVTIASTGDYIGAYTVNSVIYHFTPRRGIRV